MVNFLSLPDEVIELIGKHVIKRHDGLKAWCRLTSTCKRLWSAQLPGSAYSWSIEPDVDIERKSKVNAVSHITVSIDQRMLLLSLCFLHRRALAIAADTVDALIVGVSRSLWISKYAASEGAPPDCDGPHQRNT